MKILTKYHEETEIEESKIIQFEQGIPGFSDEQKFYILPFAEDGSFSIMQSVQTPALAFVIVSPFTFFPDYSFKLSDQNKEALQIVKEDDVSVYVILTIQEPFQKTTANLQGPLVINAEKKLGRQVLLNDSLYKTKHLLFSPSASEAKEEK
ncbi:flagellar assembly protein FliW [Bacillus sp. M6-12]|uniref:flagellar assembly protein FliW n=1 Tax=Bacillus sp. M6-12 TaxID=2054166 RepID=UPI000C7813C0|nr:flagellar assembly protein FliW [Bacillus sp. M6-12]PLS17871.1 flagellar assembly protein FliW [Bacillus sp. M6-12]